MALTRKFQATTIERIAKDPAFADALFCEGVQCPLDGEVAAGKAILRDYINGTIGFERLAARAGRNPKSLMRMFSRTGNPQAETLFPVLAHLQAETGRTLSVAARR